MSSSFAGAEMMTFLAPLGEEAGRLDHDVCPQVAPGDRPRVPLGSHFHVCAIDRETPVGDLDLLVQASQDRVVLEQVSEGGRVCEIVDGNDLEVGALLSESSVEVPADAAETVDADARRH
jgi:hypothetical protein